ncbi:MAG: heme-binding protein [bacterium]|nr:heme-binding protein [bacterium]
MIEIQLELAARAVKPAQAKAPELDAPMTVSVEDEAERLVLCARGDGAGFCMPEISGAKAIAAATRVNRTTSARQPVQLPCIHNFNRHPTSLNILPGLLSQRGPGRTLCLCCLLIPFDNETKHIV